MEIRTKPARGGSAPENAPPPEKGPYLRRKPASRQRRSQNEGRWLVPALKTFARLGLAAFSVAALLGVMYYAYSSDTFVLRTVTVRGCARANPSLLEEVVRESTPPHLLQIDLPALRDRLELEPWVRRAELRRVLPSELAVSIEERAPAAILEIAGSLMVTDAEGVLLDEYDPEYGKLDVPVFKGTKGSSPGEYRRHQDENAVRIQLGLQMLRELEEGSPAYARSISEVDLSDESNLKVLLVNENSEINMGDRDFLNRFRAFQSNMERYKELKARYGEITSVDLRFEGQIIYRPKQEMPESEEQMPAAHP